jgi:hypothetical protein
MVRFNSFNFRRIPAMPRVEFTPNLARQTHAPMCEVTGGTVAEALNEVFLQVHPRDPQTAWFVPGVKDESVCPWMMRCV